MKSYHNEAKVIPDGDGFTVFYGQNFENEKFFKDIGQAEKFKNSCETFVTEFIEEVKP